jgi:hypothetical protein
LLEGKLNNYIAYIISMTVFVPLSLRFIGLRIAAWIFYVVALFCNYLRVALAQDFIGASLTISCKNNYA